MTVVSAGLVHLTSLTNLKMLNVAYSLAGDGSMAALAELTQLQHLDLDSCPITNTYATKLNMQNRCSSEFYCNVCQVEAQAPSYLVPDNRLMQA